MINLNIPTQVILPRKTRADRKVRLNLNIYRNLNFHTNNQAKHVYLEAIRKLIGDTFIHSPPLYFIYCLYVPSKRKIDSGNVYSIIEKFFLDALVNLKQIPDDNDIYIRHRLFLPAIYAKGQDYCNVRIYSNNPFTIDNKD
jgi:hypothetical protein